MSNGWGAGQVLLMGGHVTNDVGQAHGVHD